MHTSRFNLLTVLILFFLSTVLVSCSIEKKIAKSYIEKNKVQSVLLLFPTELALSNLNTYGYIDRDSLFILKDDSIAFVKSSFIQYIEDSLFIDKCKKNFIEEIEAYGFKVYEREQINEFNSLKDSSYVFNLAQMQLEELIKKEVVEGFGDYHATVKYNMVNLNSWFELNRNQKPDEKYPILYSSYFTSDQITGEFVVAETDSVVYRCEIDSINLDDIYQLAELAGKKYAINFYDYLLNIYVQDHLPKDKAPVFYYHYDRKWNKLRTRYFDVFTEIEP